MKRNSHVQILLQKKARLQLGSLVFHLVYLFVYHYTYLNLVFQTKSIPGQSLILQDIFTVTIQGKVIFFYTGYDELKMKTVIQGGVNKKTKCFTKSVICLTTLNISATEVGEDTSIVKQFYPLFSAIIHNKTKQSGSQNLKDLEPDKHAYIRPQGKQLTN